LIGQPLELAPPIAVAADSLGIALPEGVDPTAARQDATMGTASVPIFGGNDAEIGRTKGSKSKKKSSTKTTKNLVVGKTNWES
jgi:hypothetical protein